MQEKDPATGVVVVVMVVRSVCVAGVTGLRSRKAHRVWRRRIQF